MTTAMCRLAGVSKRFGDRVVLDGLDLTVAAGEMVALTGRSGTGKTTALNVLGLLEPADSGTVTLFGEQAPRVNSRRAVHLLRSRLAYLFQNFALIDNATVDDNLRVAQTYAEGGRTAKRHRRAEALERVGLAGIGAKKPYQLSGGEQQRVALARLFLRPADLVLADEPTGSLDTGSRDAVMDILGELHREGRTIVVVTHDPVVARACGRIVDL
ncbi:ABC transporter ATP-binding protein [Actinoplanes sp. NBRC 101535]|uniref:ABC transporter ATP-binding protein n=1 Tax=Actinoplanes sp. NBRC 101535 TaxID=3032196 RepID=UPI00249FD70E|nr:ABC transporter ATP-binding protein [Actinoplanes sp. NBRC 101535]GLY06704.1 bacteriocin ABC transporter ATP-binding protein [Actinoplanes sp. NBRC 101535]